MARFDDARIDVERFETTPQIDDWSSLAQPTERAEDVSVTTASPLPNPSMSGRSPYNANVVSPFHVRGDFLRDWLVCKFHASTFELIVERPDERLGAVVVSVFEVRVRFRFCRRVPPSIWRFEHCTSREVVYLGEAAFPLARQTYPTR